MDISKLSIRRLEASELPLLRASFYSQHHPCRLATQNEGKAEFLVAWYDGEAVGSLLLWLYEPADDAFLLEKVGGLPYLADFGVREDMRSHGIGTRLIEHAEDILRARGASEVGVAVGVENSGARRLYGRLGYRESDLGEFEASWPYVDGDGNTRSESEICVYLSKQLEPESR